MIFSMGSNIIVGSGLKADTELEFGLGKCKAGEETPFSHPFILL